MEGLNWLQTLRLDAELEQESVAKALAVSVRTYQRWEASPDDLPAWRVARLLAELDPAGAWILVIEPDSITLESRQTKWVRA